MGERAEIVEAVRGRFWTKVDVGGEGECWEWQGTRAPQGYGRIRVFGEYRRSHRVAYMLRKGEITKPFICHHCDNPPCVNPNHLYNGTPSENLQDAYDRGGRNAVGAENPKARLTPAKVEEIRDLLATTEVSQREIGERFGVDQKTISDIHIGKTWTNDH